MKRNRNGEVGASTQPSLCTNTDSVRLQARFLGARCCSAEKGNAYGKK
jgi:hypothetical protein